MPDNYGSLTSGAELTSSSSMSIPDRYPSITVGKDEGDVARTSSIDMGVGDEDTPLLGASKRDIPGLIQVRHQLGILIFVGMTFVCSMRQNVSVTMVAMVNDSAIEPNFEGNDSWVDVETCQASQSVNSTAPNESAGEFAWDAHTQELLLAGFMYGYIFTQLPGGWLADRFGMKWVMGLGILLSSVCTLLGPVAASAGVEWYFVTRIFSGLGEGVTFPCMLALWSRWAHPSERSSLSVIGFAGFNFGNVVGNSLTGYLIGLDIAGGWPFTFYVYGATGVLWFILWGFLAYSSPEEHPWISREEREYLAEGLKLQMKGQRCSVPWGAIFLSPVMWMLLVVHFSHALGMFTLLANLPLYYSDGLAVSIESSGIYSALPFALQFVFMIVSGHVSDGLIARNILSKLTTRKLMSTVGFWGGAFFLVLTGLAGCSIAGSVTFVTMSQGMVGILFSGHFIGVLDVAGQYAGSAMGMMNTAGSAGGIVGPYIVGVVTEVQSDIRGWQQVMWIIAGILSFGGAVYVLFGTAELQPWAGGKSNPTAATTNGQPVKTQSQETSQH